MAESSRETRFLHRRNEPTNGQTDGWTDQQTDRRTDRPSCRDAFLTDASNKWYTADELETEIEKNMRDECRITGGKGC